jgi:hypothetical protein
MRSRFVPRYLPPIACESAMNALLDKIGCCYQSLYNNTEFLQWLFNAGVINDTTIVESVVNLGRAPEWNLCVDNLPTMCEVIAAPERTQTPLSSISSAQGLSGHISLLGSVQFFMHVLHMCI